VTAPTNCLANCSGVTSRVTLWHDGRSAKRPRREIGWQIHPGLIACQTNYIAVDLGREHVNLHAASVAMRVGRREGLSRLLK
jgi:hypothetical protein